MMMSFSTLTVKGAQTSNYEVNVSKSKLCGTKLTTDITISLH